MRLEALKVSHPKPNQDVKRRIRDIYLGGESLEGLGDGKKIEEWAAVGWLREGSVLMGPSVCRGLISGPVDAV
jgi:hypothetical protein